MKIKLLLVSLAVAGSTYAQVGPADLSVGFGGSLEGEATFQAPFISTNGPEANYSQSIEVEGYDITFTLGIEAANASLITGDGTNGLVNVRSDVEIALFGGNNNRWLDARSAGSADDESLKLTLSASGSGVSNLTSLALESAEIRRFGLINGSSNEVAWTDGSATYSTTNSADMSSGFFSYNNTSSDLNHYELTGLTPLSTNNVGGLGDDSWNLALSASDASGTLSSFTLGGIKVNFALNTYTNEAPVADSQSVEVEKNSSLPITLTATDKEMDAVYSILDAPTSGTLNTNMGSSVIYTPNTDYLGLDSFTFVVEDADYASTGTVSVTVLEPTIVMSFTKGTGNISGQTDSLILNTETLVVGGGGLTNATTLSGASAVNDEFTLDVNSGYAFVRAAPTWDTTAYASNNIIRYETDGLAPYGLSENTFSAGEILFFTVSGLEEGNSLNLSSYTISGNLPKNVDFYYEHTSGTDGIQRVDTLVTTTDIDVSLSNGDTFGFASWLGNLKENGNVGEITFNVIPEPKTAYELWEEEYGLQEGPDGDDDGDGLENLTEYGIGGNPTNPAEFGYLPTFGRVIGGGSNWFEYIHVQQTDPNSGLNYYLELSDNLVSNVWSTNGYTVVGSGPFTNGFDTVTNQIDTEIRDAQFIRLVIEQE